MNTTIQLSDYAKKAIENYIENRKRHAEKVAHIHDLRGKADNLENRAESLATELRTARAEYKAAKEAYQATADMAPVEKTLQHVKALEAELAVVQELQPVARRAADDAARNEFIGEPRIPYEEIANSLLEDMPPELGLALYCLQKAYGPIKIQEGSGSGRWILAINKLVADTATHDKTIKEMIEAER